MPESKTKLIEILQENKKMKEELSVMKKMKEANLVKTDTQVTPPEPAPAAAGGKLEPDVSSKGAEVQKEQANIAKADTQTQPSASVAPPGEGTPLNPDAASQDDLAKKAEAPAMEKVATKEQADSEEEDEEEEENEEKLGEAKKKKAFKMGFKLREMEDDMTKLVEIIEVLKNKVEALEAKVLGNAPVEPAPEAGEAKPDEMPMPPMSESMTLRNVFTEIIDTKKIPFSESARKVLYS